MAWKPGAGTLLKYLDDFVSVQLAGSGLCQRDPDAIRVACNLTGFEVHEEKQEGPAMCLDVLGIEVDAVAWELRVSQKKLQALKGGVPFLHEVG